MRELSAVFTVGAIGLAAVTGTLGALALAGAFGFTAYAVMSRGGRKRIEREVQEELMTQDRATTLLDRFLQEPDENKGPWRNAREIDALRDMFPHAMAGKTVPDRDTLFALRQRAQIRADNFKGAIESRVPLNEFAARLAGIGTFLCPPVGVAAVAYTAYAGAKQRKAARDAARARAEASELRVQKFRSGQLRDAQARRRKQVRARKVRVDIEPADTPAVAFAGGGSDPDAMV